jgi:hypothetical protein
MPPRGAAAAPAGGDPFAALPHALSLHIFSRLTVEQRLRCIEVCRGWRATLLDHSAWLQLDLTRADGNECTEALLHAATSRAGGQLRSLRLACGARALHDSLCAVAAGNAAELQELTELYIYNWARQLLDAPAAVLLANALRANTSVAHGAASVAYPIVARRCGCSRAHGHVNGAPAAATAISFGEPTRRRLATSSRGGRCSGRAALANAPALQSLHIDWCGLGDAGMEPVVDALRHNQHLTKLNYNANNVSGAFVRNTLLPALRANTSLRELFANESAPEREAAALVAARARTHTE